MLKRRLGKLKKEYETLRRLKNATRSGVLDQTRVTARDRNGVWQRCLLLCYGSWSDKQSLLHKSTTAITHKGERKIICMEVNSFIVIMG